MRLRAEKDVADTVHAAFWERADAQEAPRAEEHGAPREVHEARLAEIFQQERELAKEKQLLETHSKSIAVIPRWNAESGPPSQGEPSAPAMCGYEMGVLMCTYAAQGWRPQLEELLKSGVNVDTHDYDKRTALHLAASEGHVDVVECLLSWSANVNATDRMGFSPLVDACRHGHLGIQNLLRRQGGQLLGMTETVARLAEGEPALESPKPKASGSAAQPAVASEEEELHAGVGSGGTHARPHQFAAGDEVRLHSLGPHHSEYNGQEATVVFVSAVEVVVKTPNGCRLSVSSRCLSLLKEGAERPSHAVGRVFSEAVCADIIATALASLAESRGRPTAMDAAALMRQLEAMPEQDLRYVCRARGGRAVMVRGGCGEGEEGEVMEAGMVEAAEVACWLRARCGVEAAAVACSVCCACALAQVACRLWNTSPLVLAHTLPEAS